MNFKMIVTDLDNTLLDNNRNISNYSKDILEKCIKNNILIVFATARPIRVTKIFFPVLKPNIIICHNGAEILIDNNIIYQCGIKPKTYKDIIEKINKNFRKYNLALEVDDKIYTNFDASIYWGKMDYENIKNIPNKNADKIIIGMDDISEIKKIEKYLPDELYLEINDEKIGLIMNKGATKWKAIKIISEQYKIKTENIIAFGDDTNDLEMIKNCGTGIAVENAIDEIKRNADYICGTNENNGIAHWIEKNILDKM